MVNLELYKIYVTVAKEQNKIMYHKYVIIKIVCKTGYPQDKSNWWRTACTTWLSGFYP